MVDDIRPKICSCPISTFFFSFSLNHRFIEDEESEIAKAIGETNSASVLSSNENLKNAYIVRNDSAFQYPRMLLDRILGNKRKNEELELEAARMKKICIKMYQNIRLQSATSSGETIEIS